MGAVFSLANIWYNEIGNNDNRGQKKSHLEPDGTDGPIMIFPIEQTSRKKGASLWGSNGVFPPR
jgi:hypothetical protein